MSPSTRRFLAAISLFAGVVVGAALFWAAVTAVFTF